MFQFTGFASHTLCIQVWMTPKGPGFPIGRSQDHSLVASSSGHIAGSNVLHRLSTPRHPPCALIDLISPTRSRFQQKTARTEPRQLAHAGLCEPGNPTRYPQPTHTSGVTAANQSDSHSDVRFSILLVVCLHIVTERLKDDAQTTLLHDLSKSVRRSHLQNRVFPCFKAVFGRIKDKGCESRSDFRSEMHSQVD